jgi:hypothetical protein
MMIALKNPMMRLTKGIMCLGLLLGLAGSAGAFSLLGPFKIAPNFAGDEWQGDGYAGRPQGLGYSLAGDIGGPMLPFEAYRWNVPVLTYAFDYSFLQYFGPEGVRAVDEAIAILNALPPASQMSATLTEFPFDTKHENGTAATLGLLDVKSLALSFLLEEMGLANPERFVWGLRGRATGPGFTNYSVVNMNFDPVTLRPSRYVNGVLYNYVIFDDLGPQGAEWASAVEWYQLDPLYQPYSSVAGALGGSDLQLGSSPDLSGFTFGGGFLGVGQYFDGLTRDDVGGLRHLLSTNTMFFETLLPTVLGRSGGGSSSPWAPVLSTNVFGTTNQVGTSNIVVSTGTNFTNFVRTALRPGVDKITFQRVPLLGTNFTPITLRYTDRLITNMTTLRVVKQPVERLVLAPDIIFAVRDLGTVFEIPVRAARTTTANWTNNAALNSFVGPQGLGGPGTINPTVVITFGDMLPYFLNLAVGEGDVDAAFNSGLWGSFDGTTDPPVVFPIYSGYTLEDLRDLALGRSGN